MGVVAEDGVVRRCAERGREAEPAEVIEAVVDRQSRRVDRAVEEHIHGARIIVEAELETVPRAGAEGEHVFQAVPVKNAANAASINAISGDIFDINVDAMETFVELFILRAEPKNPKIFFISIIVVLELLANLCNFTLCSILLIFF